MENKVEIESFNRSVGIISSAMVCVCVIQLLTMLDDRLLSIYAKGTVTLLILGFLAIALLILQRVRIRHICLILSMIIYDFLSIMISGGGIGSVMIQLYIIITVVALSNCRFTPKSLKFLLFIIILVWISWILRSKDYYIAFEYRKERETNSNTVAQVVLFCYMFFSIFRKCLHKKMINSRFILFLCTIMTLWSIWECKSRTTLIAFLLFIVLMYVIPLKTWRKRLIIMVTAGIMIAGLTFPIAYLTIGKNRILQDFVYQLTGRTLYTGREILWKDYYNGFGNSIVKWVFGQGSHTESITGIHNTYLLVMLNFGIIGEIFYMIFILMNTLSVVQTQKWKRIPEYQLRCVFMTWCFLLIGWMETVLMWNPTILMCYMALGLGQNESVRKMFLESGKQVNDYNFDCDL